MTPAHKPSMEERFEQLENRIIRIVTIALTCVGLVVVIGVAGIGFVVDRQSKQGDAIEELNDQHKELKQDFGHFLLSTYHLHKEALGMDQMVNRYNPSRGGDLIKPKSKK